ncbi:MAG: NYN domain-containing protein [Alphaproteobacteria bacterium]
MAKSADFAVPGVRCRTRVFVDFWNYELSTRNVETNFRTDWTKIGMELAREANTLVNSNAQLEYQGVNVYSSYAPNPQGRKHRHWAETVLDRFAGVHVYTIERQRRRSGPKCPSCYAVLGACPACGGDMRGTEEKGIDTRIVTDMISLAWVDNYDVAVLVSSDKDFVPVAEFLQTKGIKVIHAAFPPLGAQLTQKCWGSMDVRKLMERFRR